MTIKQAYENITAALRGLCVLESIPSLVQEATEERVHARATLIRDGGKERELIEAREKLANWEIWAEGIIESLSIPVNRGNVFDNVRESIDTFRTNQSNAALAGRKLASTLDLIAYEWQEWARVLLAKNGAKCDGGDERVRVAIDTLLDNQSIALSITEAARDGNSDAVDVLKEQLKAWREFAREILLEFKEEHGVKDSDMRRAIGTLLCGLNDRAEDRDHTID